MARRSLLVVAMLIAATGDASAQPSDPSPGCDHTTYLEPSLWFGAAGDPGSALIAEAAAQVSAGVEWRRCANWSIRGGVATSINLRRLQDVDYTRTGAAVFGPELEARTRSGDWTVGFAGAAQLGVFEAPAAQFRLGVRARHANTMIGVDALFVTPYDDRDAAIGAMVGLGVTGRPGRIVLAITTVVAAFAVYALSTQTGGS